jgi:nucleotide-binding universal stress UspA family protein
MAGTLCAEICSMKIVVGVDLSPESEIAVAHAVDIARHVGANITLVMADCVPDTPTVIKGNPALESPWNRSLEQRLTADRERLGALRERWSGQGVEISQLVVDGFADDKLVEVSAEIAADLIVVGSHGRTGFRRWFMGSVAERTVRLASQSVVVARGEAPRGGYQRVVVGTDYSPCADKAIDRALQVIAPNATIELVHCWTFPIFATPDGAMPPPIDYAELREGIARGLAEAATKQVERIRASTDRQIELVHRLIERPAADGLVDRAAEIGADLIVVGSHGRRGVRRFMLGSVAEVTVRHAGCSVLVAR